MPQSDEFCCCGTSIATAFTDSAHAWIPYSSHTRHIFCHSNSLTSLNATFVKRSRQGSAILPLRSEIAIQLAQNNCLQDAEQVSFLVTVTSMQLASRVSLLDERRESRNATVVVVWTSSPMPSQERGNVRCKLPDRCSQPPTACKPW